MIQKRRITEFPEYRFYIPALTMKMLGGIGLCLVYTVYYTGGDTTQYFSDSVTVNKLLFTNPAAGIDVILNGLNLEKLVYFNPEIGYPVYFRDASTSFVVQIVSVCSIFGFRSYIPTTIIVSWISFIGIWNLFRVFLSEFPNLARKMAIAIFFIPSVLFWGSGILKDTFTLSAIGFFTYSFYNGIIFKKQVVKNIIILILASNVIICVKPYIYIALLPGALIWYANTIIGRISGKFLKFAIAPIFIIVTIAFSIVLINYWGSSFGRFSPDQLIERAIITQVDLKSDYYKGNSFDIGTFDNSISGILSVAHKALIAGLFRPYLLDSSNILMFISGIENTFILLMAIKVLWRVKILGIFRFFFKNHFLTFSLLFSLFFAFSVGLSTSNFGSLVRYKIPSVPFFVASLFIINYYLDEEKKERDRIKLASQNASGNAEMFRI
jgi:hypothetical protein